MKKIITFLVFLTLTNTFQILADFPIKSGINSENNTAIAYNSIAHEYLVVWSENIKMGSFYVIGPIMGQRLNKNGNPIGSAFTIFSLGTLPDVAYNSQKNEYVVVSAYLNIVSAQQVSNTGNLLGSPFELVSGLPSWPRIVYNSLSGRYLSISSYIDETPPSSSNYLLRILLSTFSIDNQQYFVHTTRQWEESPIGNEFDQSRYDLAFAPIQSPETPNGRFLLAVQTHTGINLTMLDSDGGPIDVVYDPQSQQYFRYIPFSEGSVVGGEFSVDVSFGMKAGYNLPGPAFFVVWGDNNNTWDGQEWSGIYGSFVNPYKLDYLTTDPVQDNSFPISAIYDHYAYNTKEYAKSWKPKVAYNNAGQKFMVAWRETPTTNSQNDTKVNHIRADKEYTGGSFYTPNFIISAISGNEKPKEPAIAASTINPTALITWDDYRTFSTTDCDIYGNLYSIPSVPSITVTKPNGRENLFIDTEYEITWTSYDYSNPVRIEYSTNGGATYIEIVNSTANDGSFLWNIPCTLSDYCVVKISDATDSDPFDLSDQVFSITTTKKVVTNKNDSGHGSLRQAIINANNTAGSDTIIFKIPGNGVHTIQPFSELPEITDPVLIDGFSQPGSSPNTNPIFQGCNAYLNIELDGTNAGIADGLIISCGNSVVRGLIINNFSIGNGILLTNVGHNIIEGNYLGTNYNAISIAKNNYGVRIFSDGNLVGGTEASARNIISGNDVCGVSVEGNNNLVQGNFIGTDITGLNSLENQSGVLVYNKYANVSGNKIGGTLTEARNLISGNQRGIVISSAVNSKVEGNFIGTDISGTNSLPNTDQGIHLLGDSLNVIGGTESGSANLISGNFGNGILIESANNNTIEGNLVGVQFNGTNPLGNKKAGIMITRGNASDTTCLGNRIVCNHINHNDSLGINLDGGNENTNDVTFNDAGDNDIGSNDLQNYPVLTQIEVDIATFVTGSLNSTPNTTYRIDFYSNPVGDPSGYGEGQTPIGWTEVTTDANGNVDFYVSIGTVVPAGHVITATTTDPVGNTSEFSNWIKTPAPTTYVVNNTNDSGIGSLRQAIIDANNNPGLDSIAFNIPGTGPFTILPNTELPTIIDPVIIDGYSQPGSHPNIYPFSEGSNAEIKIELSGTSVSTLSPGLNIKSDNCTIRGLAVNRFDSGIQLSGGEGHKIEGCYIGTDITGSGALGNGVGINVDSSNYNQIGGENPEARNLISGNGHGIYFLGCMNNNIQGNYIGTDVSGLLHLANTIGIVIHHSQSCLIGGAVDGLENIISNSITQGLYLSQSSYNIIQNNYVGLDRTGTTKIGNSDGIQIELGSNSNYIFNNKIGGNSQNGLVFMDDSKYNIVIDNFIGTDENWQYDLGNGLNGIVLAGHSLFPDYNSFENNRIVFNGGDGVRIEKGKYNSLSRNSISKNGSKGIENIDGGNNELTPPVVLSVTKTEVTGTTSPSYYVEVLADDQDEGRYFLGSAIADGTGKFIVALSDTAPAPHITATCTDSEGNTSEFSFPFVVTSIEVEKNRIPTEYSLYQNFPNPFNPTTKIKYSIPIDEKPQTSNLKLVVFDILGREVKTLVNENQRYGNYEVTFDAGHLSSGIYYYQIKAGDFVQSRKMLLIK
ncbi:MAG: right-handed parallel beta-helix repeat-containing protein [Ignavibacteriae bacterium]|nr:right-handed parallel beta-helix repeat-containing protein [Ignavibacteriota bacterium]